MSNFKENNLTLSQFERCKTAIISDEAHHIQSKTKRNLFDDASSWENTVEKINQINPDSILLEFTATVDFQDDQINKKYFDKLFEREVKKYESDNLRRYKRLERISDKAEKDKQYAAAINAEYRSGQLAGAYVDRKEVRVSGLEGMSREQLETKLKELSDKIDGYNAKTIEVESEDVTAIEES